MYATADAPDAVGVWEPADIAARMTRRIRMKLSEMKADQKGKVKLLDADVHFMSRITSIGMTEGTSFQVVKNDRKMPVLIYVRETLLALNRKDCDKIEVEEVGA